LTAFVQEGEQGEGKPTKPRVPSVEPGFIFAHSVYTDIVPSHFTRCGLGESYEMEFPQDVNTMPPRKRLSFFGGLLITGHLHPILKDQKFGIT